MKKFRDYISEEVVPTALVKDGSIDIDKEEVRASINMALAKVTADSSITPYIALNRISKALSLFHIILPKRVYLEGSKGVEVHEIRQFGDKMGMTDQGEFVNEVQGKYYLFIQYGMNTPMSHGGQYAYPTMGGTFRVMAKVVDQVELDRCLSMAELSLAEEMNAETQQARAKMAAPKEDPHTALGDCDCSQGNSPSTKSAIKVMMKKKIDEEQIDEVSLGKLVRYKRGAEKSHGDATWETKFTKSMGDDPSPSKALARKRERGIALADKKMKGKAKVNASMPKNAYMEETQIDEISKELANRYRKRAHASYTYAAGKREDDRFHEKGGKDMKDVFGKPKFKDRPESEKAKDEKTIGKRLKGLTMAHKRLKEEKIDEVSAGLASRAAHHAYVKSDKMKKDAQKEPDMYSYVQAFHKGEKKNKQGIKFAKYAANKMEEETQIDELKQATLKAYKSAAKADRNVSKEVVRKGLDTEGKFKHAIKKRKKGLERVSDRLEEKAPPGAKFERMVKHIKKGYSKDGLTTKEKSIAYATAWKAKKREESE